MNNKKEPKPLFKVGDWVSFQLPFGEAIAQIVEDRGPIGYKGRRLYGLRRHLDVGEGEYFELPEISLHSTAHPPAQKP